MVIGTAMQMVASDWSKLLSSTNPKPLLHINMVL